MSDGLKLALAQISSENGNFRANAETVIRIVREHNDADLVVFPASFLCGHPLEGLIDRSNFGQEYLQAQEMVLRAVAEIGGPTVVVGTFEEDPFQKRILIAAPDGERSSVFEGGLRRLDIKGIRIAIGNMRYGSELRQADIAINFGLTPYSRETRCLDVEDAFRSLARDYRIPMVYLNAVGGRDEWVFEGSSFAIDKNGETTFRAAAFEDNVARLQFPLDGNGVVAPTPSPEELDYLACVAGLRAYVEGNKFPGVVIGISGGMDSALVAAMAVDALGPERVLGVTLPSSITSTDSLSDARAVCAGLGIDLETIPIGASVESVRRMLKIDGRPAKTTEENIQARMRMVALMAISNESGRLLLTTGNKSEGAVGYATLYGDMAGGFNPIKDLYKTDVWALGRVRNHMNVGNLRGPVNPIPENVIDKPPTAELAAGQTDEASLGPYPVLDVVLRGLIDKKLSAAVALDEAKASLTGDALEILTPDYVRKISNLVRSSEFKRRQSAPGVRLDYHAYRYPMTHGFDL